MVSRDKLLEGTPPDLSFDDVSFYLFSPALLSSDRRLLVASGFLLAGLHPSYRYPKRVFITEGLQQLSTPLNKECSLPLGARLRSHVFAKHLIRTVLVSANLHFRLL